ncbi:MAG: hypothetical protein AAGD22_02595 [Verrucomicrobiota bacterium]
MRFIECLMNWWKLAFWNVAKSLTGNIDGIRHSIYKWSADDAGATARVDGGETWVDGRGQTFVGPGRAAGQELLVMGLRVRFWILWRQGLRLG